MPAADSADSPDAEVSIRKQEKANIPLFSGVHLPDILSKVMVNSAEQSPELPAGSRVMPTPSKGEMTILADRIANIHIEQNASASRSSTPNVKPSKLDFEEEKENIPDSSEKQAFSASKPPAHTPPRNPFLNSSTTSTPAASPARSGSPKNVDGDTSAPSSTSPNAEAKFNDTFEEQMRVIREAVVDDNNADSAGNRTLCEAFKFLENFLKTSFTSAINKRVRPETPTLTKALEESTQHDIPELNDRALHLINMLVESGCTKDTEFISRLFDNVASLASRVHLASGTLSLFLSEEPGQAARIGKVKNTIQIVRHLEKQATSLRLKNSQRRIKLVEAAIETVKKIMDPGYLTRKSQSVPPLGLFSRQSSFASTPFSSPPYSSRPFSTPRPHSSPRVYQLPTNFSNLVGASPSVRSPLSASPANSVGMSTPINKHISSSAQTTGSPPDRMYTQAEFDNAVNTAVLATEKRHREIFKSEYQTEVRNAVAEAEMKQKEALQAEYNTAVKSRVQEAVDKLRETLEAEHAHALLKAVAEVEEKAKNESKTVFDETVKKHVDEVKEKLTAANKEELDTAVGAAREETEKMLNARLELIEYELENVTVEAERSVAEMAGRLEEARKDLEAERNTTSEKFSLMEKKSLDELRIAKETCEKQKGLIERLRAEILAMEEHDATIVAQNVELRNATRELQNYNEELKQKSDKKLAKAFEKAKSDCEALMERDAEVKRTTVLLEKTKEKLSEEEVKVTELITKLSSAELRVNRVESDSTRLLRKNEEHMTKVRELEVDSAKNREITDEMAAEMAALRKEMKKLKDEKDESQSNKAKVIDLQKELKYHKERSFNLWSELDEKKKEEDDLFKTFEDVVAKCEGLVEENRDLKIQLGIETTPRGSPKSTSRGSPFETLPVGSLKELPVQTTAKTSPSELPLDTTATASPSELPIDTTETTSPSELPIDTTAAISPSELTTTATETGSPSKSEKEAPVE